jgi:hypothetical protein
MRKDIIVVTVKIVTVTVQRCGPCLAEQTFTAAVHALSRGAVLPCPGGLSARLRAPTRGSGLRKVATPPLAVIFIVVMNC